MRVLGAAALGLACLLGAGTASAQSKARGDAAAAEALWEEGRKLRAAGKIQEACPKFEESYRLDPALGTLLNIASCHELQGKVATAWGEYRDAEQQATRAGDKKRARFAAEHARALEGRLPRLTIRAADPPPGLVVSRDGVVLLQASLGTELPVDPGKHTITASAPGREPWTKTVESASGARITVEIPALVETPVAAAAVVAPEASPDAATPADGGISRTAVGLGVGGFGVAALTVGVIFGVMTGSEAAVAEEHCPGNVCDPQGDDAVAAGKVNAWVSNIGFGVGALGLLVGGYLLLTGDPDPAPAQPASRLQVLPIAGPGLAAVRARLRF